MKTEKNDHTILQSYYDNVYYGKDERKIVAPTAHHHRLAKKLGISKGHRILDVACGTGEWLLAAQERGATVVGIDLSARAIDVCERHIPEGDFRVGNAESLPFESEQFDLVTCFGSLEHFLSPELALAEMKRVAREDAIFLLLVPNSGFLTRRLGLFDGTDQISVKEEVRSLKQWTALFEKAGLVVEKRWRDLHILSRHWILRNPWYLVPIRTLQAFLLLFWPLSWQYQVYFLCKKQ